MTTPATSTPRAATSSGTHPPARSLSWNRVIPRTMLTRGLMVTKVVREAVMGPACRAFWRRKTVPSPQTASM